MTEDSVPPTFAESIKDQTASDRKAVATYRREIEAETKTQVRAFGKSLRRLCAVELQRTERGIRAEQSATARRLAARWLRTMVAGVILFITIWSSAWLMARWFQDEIKDQLRSALEQALEEQMQDLGELGSED